MTLKKRQIISLYERGFSDSYWLNSVVRCVLAEENIRKWRAVIRLTNSERCGSRKIQGLLGYGWGLKAEFSRYLDSAIRTGLG
jgi:hypothetical protein